MSLKASQRFCTHSVRTFRFDVFYMYPYSSIDLYHSYIGRAEGKLFFQTQTCASIIYFPYVFVEELFFI